MNVTNKMLRECFDLCHDGRLFWRVRPVHHFSNSSVAKAFNGTFAMKEAGSVSTTGKRSRRRLRIFGADHLVHRIVFAIYHGLDLGDVPPILDHKDGNGLNNNPENLRSASASQNMCNRGSLREGKAKGVYFLKREKCYRAEISYENKSKVLGYFKTEEDAISAYRRAAMEIHGEFARF